MTTWLTPRVRDWAASGQLVEIDGQRIFARGQDGAGPLRLFLHGFPSSSYDWRRTLALLGEAATLKGVLSFELAGVLLLNGSVLIERTSLSWAQKALRSPLGPTLARLSHRRVFVRQFARLFSKQHPLDDAEDQWLLWRRAGGARLAHRLIHYLGERQTYASRWHGAVRDWPGELRLAWGMRDPVATPFVLARLRELRPAAPVTELPELGHYPRIEQPETIATVIEELASNFRR